MHIIVVFEFDIQTAFRQIFVEDIARGHEQRTSYKEKAQTEIMYKIFQFHIFFDYAIIILVSCKRNKSSMQGEQKFHRHETFIP